jgi:outer membrane protein assembly factor BamE (lipoprotein component of BamABCDE complex)
MKPLLLLFLLASLCAGCANPAHTYANKHPELPAAHREILHNGRIPSGTACAGMTQEQVRLAMGGFPTSQDRIGGEEAWIYSRKKLVATEFTGIEDPSARSSSMKSDASGTADNVGRQTDALVKTTIFFNGDRATHAQITEEQP